MLTFANLRISFVSTYIYIYCTHLAVALLLAPVDPLPPVHAGALGRQPGALQQLARLPGPAIAVGDTHLRYYYILYHSILLLVYHSNSNTLELQKTSSTQPEAILVSSARLAGNPWNTIATHRAQVCLRHVGLRAGTPRLAPDALLVKVDVVATEY